MDTNRLPNDDVLSEKATVALHMIEIILANHPPRWQFAIVKALGVRMVIVRELQRERPTLSA